MYVCPQCKGPLEDFVCKRCGTRYPVVEGIPCFLMGSAGDSSLRVREIYDDIYRNHQDVWADQGRSARFLSYFSGLAGSFSMQSILEIGCGEGMQLAALSGSSKFGIDPSIQALMRAQTRSNAQCAVARAEELPFPAESFDVVVTVGVMEHFEDPKAATAEITRVLQPSGHYLALIHTDMSRSERLTLKAREFLLPRFRPIALMKWIWKKLFNPIKQPLRRSYTVDSARSCLEGCGLRVTRIVTRDSDPEVPLAGRHVVILIAAKNGPR